MDENCLFCQILDGHKPASFVYEGKNIVAFHDINPEAPVHILIVPRKHIRSINDLTEGDRGMVSDMFFVARDLAKEMNIEKGYKLLLNVERGGGQIIFHIHLHLIGGWKR
ncbi:MAG TPA: histidine triad nucleotide-binding protein [Deltaproteobacteria bacterium]|nr:histidine triad nucleotide-binding protein [Deltaproteobacteria bacterium]